MKPPAARFLRDSPRETGLQKIAESLATRNKKTQLGLSGHVLECMDEGQDSFVNVLGTWTAQCDNDNDTLREVPHPSNEGLALQARV